MIDGIINKAEHRIILLLRFIIFPLFLIEFVCFIAITSLVMSNISSIHHEESRADEHCCEKGMWTLMLAMTAMYSIVFVFRVIVIVASLIGWGEEAGSLDSSE